MSSRTGQVAQMNEADQKCIHSAESWQGTGGTPQPGHLMGGSSRDCLQVSGKTGGNSLARGKSRGLVWSPEASNTWEHLSTLA